MHGKNAEFLNRATSGETQMSRKEQKEEKGNEKKEKKAAKVLGAHLDPEKDRTDPTPFKEKPSRLAMLVDPKSLDDLEKIGGIDGLLEGLGVDGQKGLLVSAEEGSSGERGEAGVEGRSGAQWEAGMEDRRRVYGRNELPERKSKSLLLLMWLAFKDKVLVSSLPLLPKHNVTPIDPLNYRSRRVASPRSVPRSRRPSGTHLLRPMPQWVRPT